MHNDLSFLSPSATKMTIIDHVRMRPAMYIGSLDESGVRGLIDCVLSVFLHASLGKPIQLEFEFFADHHFALTIAGEQNWVEEVAKLRSHDWFGDRIYCYVLRGLCRRLRVQYAGREYLFSPFHEIEPWKDVPQRGNHLMRLECELDTKILQCNNFSKAAMAERLYLISLLHSQCQTQFIDRSIQPAMQLPYRHPEGLLHLYAQQRPADPFMLCNLHFQGRWAGKTYQIALGFSNDADAQPVIRTFANQHETIGGGSLLDGVLEGIRHVMRLFLQTQTVQPRIRRSQITKHLVLIAAVEGHDFEYLHPTKDKLHAPQVAHAAREIVYHLMLEEQSRNPEFLHQCLRCLIDQ